MNNVGFDWNLIFWAKLADLAQNSKVFAII